LADSAPFAIVLDERENPPAVGTIAFMTRISVAERARLSVFIGSRALKGLAGQFRAHPLLRWRPSASNDRLVIAPQELRTADATRASEIYAGRFAFAGKVVVCDRRSPFEMTPPSEEWAVTLLGFGWLRHLRAADSTITRSNARALVDDWNNQQGRWHPLGWRVDVLSRRVISWLSQAPMILQDADVRFYRRFIRTLTRQVRHLRRAAGQSRDGLPRLQALIALTFVALCMQNHSRYLRAASRKLTEELARQILADGGHVSRNPGVLIEVLLDLLPLRQLFTHRNVPPPAGLNNAIDRIMPMLRFFRHGDGNFALFNGMGPTPVDLLATVLAYDDARGAPVSNAPHSGYQRLECENTLILLDAGRAPPMALSQEAHASCLAMELSWKQHRLVVNCGLPAVNRETWRQVTRATPAHSTVTVNDRSSCSFLESRLFHRLIGGVPIIGGPREIKVAREETADGTTLDMAHDGYARPFNMMHRRILKLSADGSLLAGEDSFMPARGDRFSLRVPDEFAIRFHLHPSIKANRLSDRHGVLLALPDRDVWTFNAYEDNVEIEESVYLAGSDGPRRTVQIVIYGHARTQPTIQWSFTHTPRASRDSRRETRSNEPELPL
jgi:uncharacterized heparinase superfamily protein